MPAAARARFMADPLTQPAHDATTAPAPPEAAPAEPAAPEPAAPEPAAPEPAAPDLTGKTLGDYRVLRLLGQGGMGQVYLAEQISLKRQVALKLLKSDLAANKTSLQRFLQEALAVARVTHANIVQIYNVGEADGEHFMALEFVEGRNLREYLEKKGTPEIPFGLRIMSQVAAALQRAAEHGIVHRDIKPDNILITRKGEVKVADFGLSRCFTEDPDKATNITQSRVTMGTPLYMSPEQVEGKRGLDHRSDIYSFGVTCYHMFAGHPPFRGTSPFEVAVQHVQKEPDPLGEIRPDLPADLCTIIHKMMAKQPEARYQTAREIARDVNRLRDLLAMAGTTALGPTLLAASSGATEAIDLSAASSAAKSGWRKAALVAAIPLALAAGFTVGWYRQQASPIVSDAAQEITAPSEDPSLDDLSPKERERELRRYFHQWGKAGGSKLDETAGLKFAIELGLLYLNQRRYDDADKFFKELDPPPDQKVPASYRLYGRLGKGMVLAFKNQPEESNKQLVATLPKGEKLGPAGPFWRTNPAVREMLAEALRFNYANAPESFPEPLKAYRRPPLPAATPEKQQ
jgi:tRNA A-37 threonylcarbamoyl transferase component Bud32